MKNFWHYMESVQEDREMEVQNEITVFGIDFMLITSITEIIFWGLISGAFTTWVITKIITKIKSLINIFKNNKEKKIIDEQILNDLSKLKSFEDWVSKTDSTDNNFTYDTIKIIWKELPVEQKREIKKTVMLNDNYKTALQNLQKNVDIDQARRTIKIFHQILNEELKNLPNFNQLLLNNPKK